MNNENQKFLNEIQSEEIDFENKKKERSLTRLSHANIRKGKDGYYLIAVSTKDGNRIAKVPEDTVKRLLDEGTSLRVLSDRCNTLSALTMTFDKPLMYYAIVAYNLVPQEEWKKWTNSNPLLQYELVHLNGDIDDIRQENIRITKRDEALWQDIKKEYKSQNKVGADKAYTEAREKYFREKYTKYPNLKVMTRVTDIVKKVKNGGNKEIDNKESKDFFERM